MTYKTLHRKATNNNLLNTTQKNEILSNTNSLKKTTTKNRKQNEVKSVVPKVSVVLHNKLCMMFSLIKQIVFTTTQQTAHGNTLF